MSDTNQEVPFERLVKVYLRIREAAQETQREFDTKLELLKSQQNEVALAIKDRLRAMGDDVTSVKTAMGTVILSKKTRYYAQDWDAMKAFILEHEAVDLLEKRVAQKNMQQFLDEHPGVVPPGLNSVTEFDVSVRKPTNS